MEHKIVSDVKHKKRKCGIIYISTLPPRMNVTKIREMFSQYGDIGRVFLQPADAGKNSCNCAFYILIMLFEYIEIWRYYNLNEVCYLQYVHLICLVRMCHKVAQQ